MKIKISCRFMLVSAVLAALALQPSLCSGAYSLVLTNGYGDCYRMNMLRNRDNYQAYRGICSYRGFSLSGCSTTGEVVMLRIKATPSMPEHFSLVSTSLRWGTTMYFLNDVFHPLCSWVSAGYENWYPFDMSCSVAMYINSGGYGRTDVVTEEQEKAVMKEYERGRQAWLAEQAAVHEDNDTDSSEKVMGARQGPFRNFRIFEGKDIEDFLPPDNETLDNLFQNHTAAPGENP